MAKNLYVGNMSFSTTEDQLRDAPRYTGDEWDWDDRERGRQVYDYYGARWFEY